MNWIKRDKPSRDNNIIPEPYINSFFLPNLSTNIAATILANTWHKPNIFVSIVTYNIFSSFGVFSVVHSNWDSDSVEIPENIILEYAVMTSKPPNYYILLNINPANIGLMNL